MARTALITGGSGGIGSACVRSLAGNYDVAFQYHSNEAAAESLVDEIENAGDTEVLSVRANVTDHDDIESMVRTVRDEMDSIDVLVNSAGVMRGQRLNELSPETIEDTVSINLVGSILCTRAVLPVMADADIGHVITVSSTAGNHGSHADPVYAASKGGLDALTRSLASSYTKENVFINAVAPGITETEILPDEWVKNAEKGYPLGRLVQPEEVAAAVRFLAETTSISGEVIEIDQGKLL